MIGRLRWPRLTVRWMMVAVAVVAVDFGLMDWAEKLSTGPFFLTEPWMLAPGFVPPLSLLVVAAVRVGRGL